MIYCQDLHITDFVGQLVANLLVVAEGELHE